MTPAAVRVGILAVIFAGVGLGHRGEGASVVHDAVFSTENQSMWSSGQGLANFKGSAFLGPQWEDASYAFWGSIPTSTAFAAMHLHPGRIGLEASFQASTGGVAVDYPVGLTFSYPDQIRAGEMFTLQSSFARKPNPKLDITGFGAEFKVDAVADIRATWGAGYQGKQFCCYPTYTGDHGGPTGFNALSYYGQPLGTTPMADGIDPFDYQDDVTLITTGGEKRVSLITIGSGTGVNFKIPGFDVAGISASVPAPLNQSTMTYAGNGNLRTFATGDPFLTLDLDVVKIASMIAQAFSAGTIPPLSADLSFDSLSTTISYALLDVALKAGPALHQDFEFVFKGLHAKLTTSDGQMAVGKMGDAFKFLAPADGSDLDITADISIDQEFINKTGLALQLGLTVDVLKANLAVFGVSLVNFGPLFTTTAAANSPPLYLLTPRPFALQGFNQETVNLHIDVVPEPAAAALMAGAMAALRLAVQRKNCPRPSAGKALA
jgi:hypothetical protein